MEREYTFEKFIIGKSNEDAVLVIREYIAGYMYFPMVLVYGERGNGKTHLAAASMYELEKRGEKVLCKSARGLADDIYRAFNSEKGLTSSKLIDRYEEYDALIIDDICGLRGRESMQKFFFKLLKKFMDDGKKLILTSDEEENEAHFEEELRKLIQKAFAVDLFVPDKELIMEYLHQKEVLHEVTLTSDAKEYLCKQAKSMGELDGLWNRGLLLHNILGCEMNSGLFYTVLEN